MDKKNAKTADAKVADAQLGLKNLSLGGPTSTPANNNKGKDKETSTKTKKSKKVNTPAPSKKISPILLGMPDSPMEAQDDVDPYTTKIGGLPLWLQEDLPAPSKYGVCESCGKQLYLLLQAYVPLEKSAYDRVVYVWACNQRLCMRKKGSFRVVRALKLNPEYSQKLEKKAKPAAPAAKPTPAANPFGAPGAFDMGNALFGGSGSGFNNPFAAPSSTANGFAPPAGFGQPVSFASAAATNVLKDDSSSDEDEQDMPEEDEIAQRYSHFMQLEQDVSEESEGGATWGGEAYEKASLPKGVDKAFQKFTERVQAWPDQCVRYDFPGIPLLFSYSDPTAQQLLPVNTKQHSKHTTPSAHRIPRCPACKGARGFEFQLMPNLLSLLAVTSQKYLSMEEKASMKLRKGADQFNIGMEWGTILVYSCVEDCFGKNADKDDGSKVKYFEEVALVQFED
ncbi:hypothetical protein BGZ92_006304 [Podila epicladia]|nr:hypothetical protein BGZ92_006304 [Podila epicladia]